VHLEETGQYTNTGGRIKRLEPLLKEDTFMVTYGDGVSDVDLEDLLRFHHSHGRIATVTAVRPPARFGGLVLDGNMVSEFSEKSQITEGWINGGFLVFEPAIFDYLEGDRSDLETDALEQLAGQDHSQPTATTAFGSAWTLYATNAFWIASGGKSARRGRCGSEQLLVGSSGLCDRRHGG
jgi:NDP-sugar pyrophosphorylase family protein